MNKLLYRFVSEVYETRGDGEGQPYSELMGWDVEEIHFDTVAFRDVASSFFTPVGGAEPQNFELKDFDEIHAVCQAQVPGSYYPDGDAFSRWSWQYSTYFRGSLPAEVEPNSLLCNYVPPTCDLSQPVGTVVGTTATITGVTGNRGQLRYYLNQATVAQTSNVFVGLPVGSHTVRVVDVGTPNCEKSVTFTVADATVEPSLPDTAPISLELALRPIWEVVEDYAAGALLLLELWVETAHNAGDYQKVYQARKVVGRDGTIGFQLDGILFYQLEHHAPDLAETSATFATRVLLNYFTRVRVVDPATQEPGVGVNRAVRTVLLAGLAMPGAFLTTQPSTKKVPEGQPEFLYFLNPVAGPATIVVHRAQLLADGTRVEATEAVDLDTAGFAAFRLVCIPVFATALDADAVRLQVCVKSAAGLALTAVQTYDIIPLPQRRRVMLFGNPCGGIDTVLLKGPGQAVLEVKSELAEGAGDWTTTPQTALRKSGELKPDWEKRATSGWLSQRQIHWLQAVLLTPAAWLHTSLGLKAIVLTKRVLPPYERDSQNLAGLTLEYKWANEQMEWEELRP